MTCPRCNSENVQMQTRPGKGLPIIGFVLAFGGFGLMFLSIFGLVIGALLGLLVGAILKAVLPKHNETVAICQNCGFTSKAISQGTTLQRGHSLISTEDESNLTITRKNSFVLSNYFMLIRIDDQKPFNIPDGMTVHLKLDDGPHKISYTQGGRRVKENYRGCLDVVTESDVKHTLSLTFTQNGIDVQKSWDNTNTPLLCPSCKKEVRPSENFCHSCGAKLDFSDSASPPTPVPPESSPTEPLTHAEDLSFSEKERLAVERTTFQDVASLENFPFVWNGKLEKLLEPNAHPFAFMDITGPNIEIAQKELAWMNVHISASKDLCDAVPKTLEIPVKDIYFRRSSEKGYTRLICSPVTYTGTPAKYPVCLSFTTDLDQQDSSTHGDLWYDQSGHIAKAEIYFWRTGFNGFFFHYQTEDNQLVLSRIETPDLQTGERKTIYKGPHILAWEARLAQEEQDFAWLQANLPDQCPKNITGFRRMKTQNTKNYQALKALAAEQGREI